MKKNTKIIIGIVAILLAGGVIYFLKRKKKKKLVIDFPVDTPISKPPSADKSQTQSATATTIQGLGGKTNKLMPFTSKIEGDLFRAWVNDYFPSYAKEINLDRTGSYKNNYIQRAWNGVGGLYTFTKISGKLVGVYNAKLQDVIKESKIIQGSKIFKAVLGTGKRDIPTGTFNVEKSAMAIYNSMKGIGTNYKQFFGTMNPITPEQRVKVEAYFNKNLGEGETLEEWIRGDMSGENLKKALEYINS